MVYPRALVMLALVGCKFEPGAFPAVRDDATSDAPRDTVSPGDGRPADARPPDAPIDALLACPTTYILTNAAEPASRYRHVTAADDWAAAEADCENDGGGSFLPAHLIVLNNEAERAWTYAQGTTDKWVGVTDIVTENTLLAITTQPNAYFGNAQSNEQPKDCLFVNQNETVMDQCTTGFPYICECDGRAAIAARYGN